MVFQYQHAGTHTFVPAQWASDLLEQFDPLLVWASRLVSNRDYEGEIQVRGDVVHVNSLIRPTVGEYTIADGMTAQRPETVDQEIPITEADYIQLLIENAERVQVASGNLSSPINRQMVRALAAKADTYMANVISSSATALPNITPVAGGIPSSFYGAILDIMLELDESDVPEDRRYVVVSPRVKRYLIEHPPIANAAAYGEGGVTSNGVVARLAGFTVASTTAMPSGVDIVAGHPDFSTFASQFNDFREGMSERYRADFVDSLHVYGGAVIRYPNMDTKKADNTWDTSKPTKGIVKAAVTWPTS
ncbi:hypothetical protein [Streptomyces sp. NPDC046909]|uniref:hypothetical protein n=1 Tax=Streptomyces sp. NPDC046909 TaxID=3155617 RepID=UPI0033DF4A64